MVAVRILGEIGWSFECKVMGLEFGFCGTFNISSNFI